MIVPAIVDLVMALNKNNLLKTTHRSFLSFAQANKNRLSFGAHFERTLIKDIHRSLVESLGSNGQAITYTKIVFTFHL